MAKKTSNLAATKKPALKQKGSLVANFPESPDKAAAEAVAKFVLKPSVNAAAVITEYSMPFGAQDLGALAAVLSSDMKGMQGGDMKRAEAMLYGQAHALQSIFMNFSRRALSQQYQNNLESFLRMALKAQNQCRMTLETLATIKNPPVVFARQANINNGGQQQVNNGGQRVDSCAPAANSTVEQTELLEASDGQRLDIGAAGTAGNTDPHMEAVAAGHRAAHACRRSYRFEERLRGRALTADA